MARSHTAMMSEPFPIHNDVKQGCVLTPTLFIKIISMMLQKATADLDDEDVIYMRYHRGGSLFNLRRHSQPTTTSQPTLNIKTTNSRTAIH